MKEHFCSCPVAKCPRHPSNHGDGCDPCIQDNIMKKKMPDGDVAKSIFTLYRLVQFTQKYDCIRNVSRVFLCELYKLHSVNFNFATPHIVFSKVLYVRPKTAIVSG